MFSFNKNIWQSLFVIMMNCYPSLYKLSKFIAQELQIRIFFSVFTDIHINLITKFLKYVMQEETEKYRFV